MSIEGQCPTIQKTFLLVFIEIPTLGPGNPYPVSPTGPGGP